MMSDRVAPWPAMLRAACAMGIAPEAFWRLGVREWRMLAPPGDDAMTRADFARLRALFPDGIDGQS
jgi:hypothetical protein